MWDLIKEYLENSSIRNYRNVVVVDYEIDNDLCKVHFKHKNRPYKNIPYNDERITLKMWDILSFVVLKTGVQLNP